MIEFISEAQVEKALDFLRDTAEDFAKWKSRARFLVLHRKSVRAAAALASGAKSMAEAKERGEASAEYKAVLAEYETAEYEFTLLDAKRNAAEAKIEAWRTIQASNRRGHV